MVHMPDTRVSIWCKSPPGGQEAWLATDPDRYYAPPYLGPKGWIAAWISPECDPDWDAIADIIDESYRLHRPETPRRPDRPNAYVGDELTTEYPAGGS